jgi:CheY-like chemotaxis protein
LARVHQVLVTLMQVSSTLTSLPSRSTISVLKTLAAQQITGQVLVRETSQDSVNWKLFLTQGKLNFATSDRDQQTRLRYLLQRYSPNLQPLEWDASQSDYAYLCQHWRQGRISLVQAKQMLSLSSLEVFVQILSLESCKLEIQPSASSLEPVLLDLGIDELMTALQGQVQDWCHQGQFVGSLFQRPRIRDTVRFTQILHQVCGAAEAQRLVNACNRGSNFYEIAYELKQDALKLAKRFYPLAQQDIIELTLAPTLLPPSTARSASTAFPPSVPAITEEGAKTSFKIACVDDSPTILQEITNCLNGSDLDFSIFPITNSVRALMWVSRIQPDLILLDVGMPGIDGYELCRMIRGNEQFKNIPIIMVTGNTGELNRAMAKEAGASDYVTKPFTSEGLVSVVKQHLQSLIRWPSTA